MASKLRRRIEFLVIELKIDYIKYISKKSAPFVLHRLQSIFFNQIDPCNVRKKYSISSVIFWVPQLRRVIDTFVNICRIIKILSIIRHLRKRSVKILMNKSFSTVAGTLDLPISPRDWATTSFLTFFSICRYIKRKPNILVIKACYLWENLYFCLTFSCISANFWLRPCTRN